MWESMGAIAIGDALTVAYRELLVAESRLGEALSPRGIRLGVSLADQWPTLRDYLSLYASGLSPAGVLVLGGAPDDGSRFTGIPFTGAADARATLGLDAPGEARSPSATAFWRAVARAQEGAENAPLESLFGSVHLAHAQPFDVSPTPEVRTASRAHIRRLLTEARPQVVVTVGSDALGALGETLDDPCLSDFSRVPESQWTARYPAGTRMYAYPTADVTGARPFRVRVVPVPSLAGATADAGAATIERVLAYAWA